MARKPVILLDGTQERALDPQARFAGIDEVGRGPLAGPVTAAAVVLDPDAIPNGLRDSKALTAAQREALFAQIMACAQVGIAFAGPAEIDRLNIRGATLAAMRRALAALPAPPDHALIDGRDVPPGLPVSAQAVVKGDSAYACIAAASIVAKVIRDRAMRFAAVHYPEYGFADNVGYPTRAHMEALDRCGPCAIHRMSFAPVRSWLTKDEREARLI
ncbi:MAG: ribonuclease HII [Salinarimonas sp.]